MPFNIPLGSEIALAFLGVLATALTIIARATARNEEASASTSAPVEPVRAADLEHITDRLEQVERSVLTRIEQTDRNLLTRIDQNERQIAQLISSSSENLARQHREKEAEDRRQADRIVDRLDRLRNGHG